MTVPDVYTGPDTGPLDLHGLIPAPRQPDPSETRGTHRVGGPRRQSPPSPPSPPFATYPVLGVQVAAARPNAACERILEYARESRSRQVHLCNAYTLTLAQRDDELKQALRVADLNLPDGAPVAWLGRKAGAARPVRGPGLVADVFATGVAQEGRAGIRHYLYGGAEGVADEIAGKLLARDPRTQIVGTECPPFRPLSMAELHDLATRIERSGADVVWIGIGTPRQDYLVAALGPLVTATLVPVGAAFDFISGRIPEAPRFLHGSGFEWLYRLAREPRRLWHRYIVDGARFAYYLVTRPSRTSADGGDDT